MSVALVAAVVLICLGLALIVQLGRSRVRALEEAGFSRAHEVPEDVRAAASGMVGSKVSLAWSKRETGEPPVWLLEIEGFGTDDPQIFMVLYPCPQAQDTKALLTPRQTGHVPDGIRRRSAGLWARLEPAGQDLLKMTADTDWLLFVDPGIPPPDAVLDALARVAHSGPPGSLIGVALDRGFLGVWVAGRQAPALAAGPKVRDAFEDTEPDRD